MKYAEKCLLPEYRKQHPKATLDDLNAVAGLRHIEKTLREEQNIRIIHNVDDPLLSAADRQFLTDTLGPRIVWFDCGGHLGSLHALQHEKQVLSHFPKPVPPPKAPAEKTKNEKK